ncbi:DoxX family protein [Vibrio sp. CJQ_6]|uniref:DoxX family protein n=1 Tax=Vibrio sp. CJQ_6 TaxID=3367165 RepID=UPI00370C1F34
MADFIHRYHALCHWLQRDFASLLLLLCRIWAGWVFWQSGLSKIANWDSTLYLFELEYQVPLLPWQLAAYLATGAELALSLLLMPGLLGRFSALALFAVNAMAVVSYPLLWQQGFTDHQLWGFMLLMVVVWGPGRLSLDHWLSRKWQRVILQH